METWYPLLTLICTAITSFAGVMISNKLVNYRLEQLEKKVEKHNTIIERTYALERGQTLLEEKIKVANHRIDDLEKACQ